jgi:hypothetical protein
MKYIRYVVTILIIDNKSVQIIHIQSIITDIQSIITEIITIIAQNMELKDYHNYHNYHN